MSRRNYWRIALSSRSTTRSRSLRLLCRPINSIAYSLLWTDPSENGLVVVDILEKKEKQSSDEMIKFLQDFLNNSFKSETDFSMDDPKEQSDGSQLIVWSYTASASGGAKVKLLGNSFI